MYRSAIVAGMLGITMAAVAISSWDGLANAQSVQKPEAFDASTNIQREKIEPYKARFGRTRPVIAVVGQNAGTEITDFVIPFGVLSRSNVADVISVSVAPGTVAMKPLRFELQSTLAEFDKRFPDGADYIVIPKVDDDKDPALLQWVAAQAAKGGTIVSICLGATVVANTGLLDGRRATSYWVTEADRVARYPNVRWERNIRYVADGKIVSSAGISASMPISIAVVEAIAGHDKAAALALDLGIENWSSAHNSDYFQEGLPLAWGREGKLDAVGIPVKPGDDEIALALTAEAYSMNGKSTAIVVAADQKPIRLAHGLVVFPGAPTGEAKSLTRMLAPISAHRSAKALDSSLADIATTYGQDASSRVARIMEYPGFSR